MTAPSILLDALEYRYGKRVALAGVSGELRRGEILGLVGPNGSGKTTLLKLLAGLLRPSAGRLRVLGLDPFHEREELMRRARFAFAPAPLFEELSAHQNLRGVAQLGGQRIAALEIEAALETVGLAGRGRDRVSSFSMGMKQRLALAQALLPRPELLILDEPNDGLDPLAVLELRAVLQRLRDEHGVTILLSSHLMVEVEELVDRVLVLMEGQVEFWGTPAELVGDAARLILTPTGGAPRALAEALRAAGHGDLVVHDSHVALAPGSLDLEGALAVARAAGLGLRDFHLNSPSMESALLARQRRRAQERGC